MTLDNFIEEAKEQLAQNIESEWRNIETAYLKNPDELSIAVKIKVAPGKVDTQTVMEMDLSFVKERVKSSTKGIIDDRQMKIE